MEPHLKIDPALTPLAVSVDQAAKMLGCGRTKIWQEISAGRLKAKKFGHRVLVRIVDAQEWLANLPEIQVKT
jgi:excisionase family DNA binding protein